MDVLRRYKDPVTGSPAASQPVLYGGSVIVSNSTSAAALADFNPAYATTPPPKSGSNSVRKIFTDNIAGIINAMRASGEVSAEEREDSSCSSRCME